MKIGDLAKSTGVSVPTIRLYEREGLIAPAQRTSGQSRIFSESHEARLVLIKRLRLLGFELEQIRPLLALLTDSRSKPLAEFIPMLAHDVRWRIEMLLRLQRAIGKVADGSAEVGLIQEAITTER